MDVETHEVASELRRLNWAVRAYGRASSALVRFQNPNGIAAQICEAIVADGSYALAWVGVTDESADRRLHFIGAAGAATGYLDGLTILTAGTRPEANGPAGIAIRTGQPFIMQDALADPAFVPWRERARRFGLRAGMILPLESDGVVIGGFAIYAPEPGTFGAEEVRTFETLAGDLAFAISAAGNRRRLIAAEARTQEMEARFQAYFHSAPIAVLVADSHNVLIEANPAAEALFGYSAQQLCGMTPPMLHPPETRDRVAEALVTLAREKRLQAQLPALRADGRVFQSLVTVAQMADGRQIGYFQDVDALYRAESYARTLEARFQTYFDNAPIAMLVADSDKRIVDANPAARKLWGYSAEAFCTLSVPSLHAPEDAENAREGFAILMRTGSVVREHRMVRADGSTFAAMVTGTMLPEGRFLGFFEDIEDRRRRDAQLQQAQRLAALGEMMTGLAHELNQPLTAISMSAENAMFGLPAGDGSARLATKLQTIVDQAMRASEIIQNARRFGRPDAGRAAPSSVPEAAKGAIALVENRLKHGQIAVHCHFAVDLPHALVSAVQLEQVLTNLLLNACDAYAATPTGDRSVRIEAAGVGGEVLVTVADHAGGIPPDSLPRIFEPFYTTKPDTKGTGLGLSISYGIVVGAGGSLTATNRNGGATFEIRLPAAPGS